MKKLIVTADDYGVFPSINAGILNAVLQGKVNSVACFANYEKSVENVRELIDAVGDKAEIGCHLTISSGVPVWLGNHEAFTKNGIFRHYTDMRISLIEDHTDLLEKELKEQVAVFRAAGINVKHLSC